MTWSPALSSKMPLSLSLVGSFKYAPPCRSGDYGLIRVIFSALELTHIECEVCSIIMPGRSGKTLSMISSGVYSESMLIVDSKENPYPTNHPLPFESALILQASKLGICS